MATEDGQPWRVLAAAAGFGGALFAVWLPLDDLVPDLVATPGTTGYLLYYLGWVVASLALAVGVYGLYRFRSNVAGGFGTAALGITGLGFVALAVGAVLAVATVDAAATVMPAGLLLAVLGGAGLGVVTFRVAGFDRRAGLLLVVALLGLVVAFVLGGVVTTVLGFGVAVALCSVPYGVAWVVFGRSLTVRA